MAQASENNVTVFAKTNFRHRQQPFGIKRADRRYHMYVLGKTGMGKTTLLENLILSDIHQGEGLAILEPHGDLIERLLERIPSHRINDVIYFNPADRKHPISLNLLEAVAPEHRSVLVAGIIEIFKMLYEKSWGTKMEHIFRHTLLTAMEIPGATIFTAARLLTDLPFREKITARLTSKALTEFWEREFKNYDKRQRTEAVSPILNKIGQFSADPLIRNIVGQGKSKIRFRKIIDDNSILLANLSKGKIRFTLAYVAAKLKDHSRAIALLNTVIENAAAIQDLDLVGNAYENLEDIHREMGEKKKALVAYERAVAARERIVNRLKNEQNRASYYERIRYLLEKQIDLAYQLGDDEAVFDYIEKAKSRTFLGLLASRESALAASADSTVSGTARRLRNDIANLHSQIISDYSTTTNPTQEPGFRALLAQIDTAEAEYANYMKALKSDVANTGALLAGVSIGLGDVQHRIPAKTLLLQYAALEDYLLICAVTNHQLNVFKVALSRIELRREINGFIDQMQKDRLDDHFWRTRAQYLGQVLFDSLNVNGLLNEIDSLIILPDDYLHYLPFQVLVQGDEFITSRFIINNYPSASVMNLLHFPPAIPAYETVLAMGYSSGSLHFIDAEVKAIKQIFGDGVILATGKTATKKRLQESASRFDVIHIAAHSIPAAVDPLLFAIQLAPDSADAGRLYVHEVFGLKLKRSLVVLSGCETGVEKHYERGVSAGGELVGLIRAFLYAGAGSVVSTLWKVDDEASAVFMQHFYRELRQGATAATALQRAQQAMITNPKFRHPFFWAAYVLSGA